MAESSTAILADSPQHQSAPSQKRFLVLLAFFCIYIVWGSTYLAVRYAVETIPPLFVAGLRHLVAGGLLFAWCWWRGLRPNRQQWFASVVVGAFFFLIGHGTMHWAMQTIPSGLTALLVATEPIWIAVLIASTSRTRIKPSLLAGLVLGIVGVSLLFNVDVNGGQSTVVSTVAVLLGTFSWAVGIIYSRKSTMHPDPIMSAAMSLLAGAVMLLLTGTLVGETAGFSLPAVSLKSALGLAYLAIMGSLISYSAYFWLLQRCPPTLVATHTYVNPIVALVLGWAVAGESLNWRTIVSGIAVVGAIALVSLGSRREARTNNVRQEQVCASALERETA